jgi:hypothetical protein
LLATGFDDAAAAAVGSKEAEPIEDMDEVEAARSSVSSCSDLVLVCRLRS